MYSILRQAKNMQFSQQAMSMMWLPQLQLLVTQRLNGDEHLYRKGRRSFNV